MFSYHRCQMSIDQYLQTAPGELTFYSLCCRCFAKAYITVSTDRTRKAYQASRPGRGHLDPGQRPGCVSGILRTGIRGLTLMTTELEVYSGAPLRASARCEGVRVDTDSYGLHVSHRQPDTAFVHHGPWGGLELQSSGLICSKVSCLLQLVHHGDILVCNGVLSDNIASDSGLDLYLSTEALVRCTDRLDSGWSTAQSATYPTGIVLRIEERTELRSWRRQRGVSVEIWSAWPAKRYRLHKRLHSSRHSAWIISGRVDDNGPGRLLTRSTCRHSPCRSRRSTGPYPRIDRIPPA